jgi:AP-3 complex subunit delta-1
MALRKVKGNFERMFDKNLTDLVRGIRNNKDNEVSIASVVTKCVITICDG